MSTEVNTETAAIEVLPHSDAHVFSPKETADRVRAIHTIMSKLMEKDTHYGVIPGTKKPTLYKPGSEILLLAFRIAIEPEIADLSTPEEIRYRIRALGRHVPTGAVAGIGVGECSSKEEKFLWREAVSKDEFEETPEDQKRVKHKRKWDNGWKTFKVQQIKVPPADAANAVLKRAKKRAQVDFVLTAMAASEIFTQDVEDLPEGYLSDDARESPAAPALINEAQLKEISGLYDQLNDQQRKAKALVAWGVESLEELPASKYATAKAHLTAALKNKSKSATVSQSQEMDLTALTEEIGGDCKVKFLEANKIKKISELPASQYQGALAALEQQRRQ